MKHKSNNYDKVMNILTYFSDRFSNLYELI